jgi:DNA polymerase sigma
MATTASNGDMQERSQSLLKTSVISSSSNSSSTESANTDSPYINRLERDQLLELDRELLSFVNRVIPSTEDNMSHKVVLDLVRDVARRVLDPSADIQMFGSAASGFCERGSDIDATILVDFAILNKRFHGKNRTPSVGHETRMLCSEAVSAIAKYVESTNGTGLAVEGLISGAKVPIVVLSSFGRQIIDASINNVLPTYNTRLLGEYAKMDPRVVALVLCVKRWAKMAQVSDAKMGNLSSYSWSLLVIYFLQKIRMVPSLQGRAPPGIELYQCPSTGKTFDITFLSGREAQMEKSLLPDCNLTAAELLCAFFTFYDKEFKWGTEVVSIRIGGHMRKSINDPEFALLSQGSRTMMELPPGIEKIHIEDPFDLTRNLHCVMDMDGLVRLRKAFSDISGKLSGAPVSVLAGLAKTLMNYKNVVPVFATAELTKRYNGVGVRGSPTSLAGGAGPVPVTVNPIVPQPVTATITPSPPMNRPVVVQQLDEERAQAIVRNYARQQEILGRQLLNMQQQQQYQPASGVTTAASGNAVGPAARGTTGLTPISTASTGNVSVARTPGQPGRGSYRQSVLTAQGATEWTTVDLW